MRKTVAQISFLSLSSLALGACVAPRPPYEDYTLARTAISAARDVDAAKNAPGFWNRAEDSYRSAEREYQDNDFSAAKKHFVLAREYAEKAENATKLKKFQSGDSYP
jgi:hypothetical protein